ncbi:exo-alpha-sialidase [bacterium]|nr:exo-alpha-sialidase [bacterium]
MNRLALLLGASVLLVAPVLAGDRPAPIFPRGMKEPQVAVSPAGAVFVVAGNESSLQVASSQDGKAFSQGVEVARAKVALGCRRGPRIAATEKSVVVTAVSTDKDAGQDGDLLSWRSDDQGKTWKGPVKVNTKRMSAREGLQALAAGPKDELVSVWLDDRNGGKEVMGARSTDGGATWIDEASVYKAPGTEGICPCCHPSVSWNAKGEVTAMFRNGVDRARDMWLVTSKDHGKTWIKPQKLGEGSWPGDT